VREPDERARASELSRLEHDLSNALASIVGFSRVIGSDPSLPEDLRHSADLLLAEADRTRAMVQELLALTRSRAPDGSPDASPAPTAASLDPAPPTATSEGAREVGTFPSHAAAGGHPRVLVLDDEPAMRVFLEKALLAMGYEPVITAIASDAVARATSGDHEALLFDHQMPGMSGVQALEAVLDRRPELATRFVMMSGDVQEPSFERFVATHGVRLLSKPFDLDTLDRTIREVLQADGQSRG
jgi:CheY-like chemotaxis protein